MAINTVFNGEFNGTSRWFISKTEKELEGSEVGEGRRRRGGKVHTQKTEGFSSEWTKTEDVDEKSVQTYAR